MRLMNNTLHSKFIREYIPLDLHKYENAKAVNIAVNSSTQMYLQKSNFQTNFKLKFNSQHTLQDLSLIHCYA